MSGPVDHPSTRTLTRAELVDRLHAMGFSRRDAHLHVDGMFELMRDALAAGEEVKLSGFGKFEVRDKLARMGRNPSTGAPMELEARRVVLFRASPSLREALTAALALPDGEAS